MLHSKAFTIVEILIAISIVAIFITMPVLAYSNYSRSQRDIKRKSDINQIQQALTQYKSATGAYPDEATWDTDLINAGYLPKLPVDPADGRTVPNSDLQFQYDYNSDGVQYELTAVLENTDKSADPGEVSIYRASSSGGASVDNIDPTTEVVDGRLPTRPPLVGNSPIPSLTTAPSVTAKPPTGTRTPTPTITPTPEFTAQVYEAGDIIAELIRGSDGNMWFTTYSASQEIGKLDSSGTITHYNLPLNCTYPSDIVSSSTRIWLVSPGNIVCSTDFNGNVIDQFPVDTTDNRSITIGSDNNLWVASHTENRIYKINPSTGANIFYNVTKPRKVEAAGSYIWYANSASGTDTGSGRLATANGAEETFGSYAGQPTDMVISNGNNSSYIGVDNNYILEFEEPSEQIYLLEAPVDTIRAIARGTDSSIWFVGTFGTTPRMGKISTVTREGVRNWDIPTTGGYDAENIYVQSSSVIWYTSGRWIYKLTLR